MKLIKSYSLTIIILLFTFSFGILLSNYTKPLLNQYGLRNNWLWPILCLIVAIFFSSSTHTKIHITGGKLKGIFIRLILGLFLGIVLQYVFYHLHLRRGFAYQGIALIPLIFQVTVSLCEEILFRGTLQEYLGKSIGDNVPAHIVGATLVSIPFGLIHGLNPVIFNQASFDTGWCIGTFITSLLCGITFGLFRKVDIAFGVHIGFNLIATFF